ncbi:PP2C family protein-serine/threonine phosphatase [Eisenibacter elegans]|uniref:PP2C family protein-serine/threonine phosphatase n=1 Tax=Eisenibacter elegans TaxID=997 RepID=UPI00047AAAE6|nr:SpoIIE family protein phosphatase [Eisenibacter elegans]
MLVCEIFPEERGHTLREYRGDRQSIGGLSLDKELVFTQTQFCLKPGDQLYIATDGVSDICNPQHKTFGKNRLKDLIRTVANYTFNQQKYNIERVLSNFQSTAEQRDDVTLVGLKI